MIEKHKTIGWPYKLNLSIHLFFRFSPFFTDRIFIRPSTAASKSRYHDNKNTKTGSMWCNNKKTLNWRWWKILLIQHTLYLRITQICVLTYYKFGMSTFSISKISIVIIAEVFPKLITRCWYFCLCYFDLCSGRYAE